MPEHTMPTGKGKNWLGGEELPTMKVLEKTGELRRREKREPPDPIFCFIDEDWNWHRVTIALMLGEDSPENNLPVELVDCSELGLSISCTRAVARGAAIGVVGMDAIDRRVLFTDHYRVRNVRKRPQASGNGASRNRKPDGAQASAASDETDHISYTFGAVVSDSLVKEPTTPTEFVYGLYHEEEASYLLTKATLDSVFLNHLREQADLDIIDTLIEIKNVQAAFGTASPAG